VLANSGSYGILAEMNRQEHDGKQPMTIYGAGEEPFAARGIPEEPGHYCFPPFAAIITAAARLMLALLEHFVSEAGGTYAYCDTDSMAIVSTEQGQFVPCEGGNYSENGQDAIKALPWARVREIARRFEHLNPYDPEFVPGSILKVEDENYDKDGNQHQLFAYATSAKRNALFTIDPSGRPNFEKSSEHGLGHLLNPADPRDNDNKTWIKELWDFIVSEALGQEAEPPHWLDRAALGRQTIARQAGVSSVHIKAIRNLRAWPSDELNATTN
jgi:hypothetical protein